MPFLTNPLNASLRLRPNFNRATCNIVGSSILAPPTPCALIRHGSHTSHPFLPILKLSLVMIVLSQPQAWATSLSACLPRGNGSIVSFKTFSISLTCMEICCPSLILYTTVLKSTSSVKIAMCTTNASLSSLREGYTMTFISCVCKSMAL